MKLNRSLAIIIILLGVLGTSCVKDLNVKPKDPRIITSATVFDKPEAYKQFLAKLYATLSLTGQKGESGLPEISAPDEGTTAFLRGYWALQEVTTDECINAWGDGGLVEYHGHAWSDQNSYVNLMYQRLFINISYCNEMIRAVNDNPGGLSGTQKTEIDAYQAEARFLRAYFYACAMDIFGNVPFVTEADKPGAFLPKQIKRADLFNYVESELKAVADLLPAPGSSEYARANKAAAWALLSRIYLNAQVYTGSARYDQAITYANMVINSGAYTLHDNYAGLFLADNHLAGDEIILPIASSGANSRSYGDVTFIIHAGVGGSMDAANDYGIASGGWNGNRMTTAFVDTQFPDPSGATDKRAIFHTDGQTLTITNPTIFTEGYLCAKWKNVTSTGEIGGNATFVETDFPLFRLAEVYLNYAEATVRGGAGGDAGKALQLVNELRARAYGNTSGNITSSQLTLDFLLQEKGREFYWEAQRRTDLIRHGKFTGSDLLWDFKGGVMAGTGTAPHFSLFPIPASDLQLNNNLVQNPGY
ncbi:RagB/SusD family nutrient uptake outer membrane protein [Mucilaginibacter hurinus]|uniref:RagB/SusD family nutrient uptake outer membrane protein n=1 Tax=Mucilaginibacter hurinus TaxID=2201324 RepID=A0A367GS88_9SPHI|nr:RagB/SusD family nutrient uptake outer membrane protein [Mucilaginibacter hurinus]RCH55696.1 RagB/SusD family nutrient uptake outer membrane protein [Mucilaginibacter hurinus]